MTNPLSPADRKRIETDNATMVIMLRLYCRYHHRGLALDDRGLCAECSALADYSIARTNACPFKHRDTCDTCTVQCYAPAMRAQIKSAMAYSGPRMIFRHPLLAIRHLAHKRRSRRRS